MIRLFQVYMDPQAATQVEHVLRSGYIGQGERVEQFEHELSRRMDGAELLTVNSCTSALDLALHLCGVGPGDRVVTTPQTCTATNGVIVRRGATPVWADIDPQTGNIDPIDVAAKVEIYQPKAIMAVDWGGRACDYNELRSLGVPVIEDAAHAVSTRYSGMHVARTGGDYVCFSFQAIKHLTTGDGGALKVPDEQIDRARKLRWYGLDRRSKASYRCEQNIDEVGYKYHMNDIAATIGLANLAGLEEIVGRHIHNAKVYCEELGHCLDVMVPDFDAESSWWIYSILVRDPIGFISKMAEQGIECSPVHARNDKHSAFREAAISSPLPGVDTFTAGHVAIPVGWWLSDDDLQRVIDATKVAALT